MRKVTEGTIRPETEALAGFLSALDFSHFCTFTSRKPISVASTRRIAENVAVFVGALPLKRYQVIDTNPWLAKDSATPVYSQVPAREIEPFTAISTMFWAAEKFDTREGYHFHALINTPVHNLEIFNWYFPRYGRCQIINNADADKRHSASYYCSKYITKSLADYDIYFADEIKNRAQTDLFRVLNDYDRKV